MKYLLAALLAVSWISGTASAQEDGSAMNEEWFETRPICFGQYVADVPKILQPTSAGARLEGFTITNLGPAGQEDLDAKIEDRRTLMEAGGPIEDSSFVRYQGTRQDGNVTVILYDFFDEFDPEYRPPSHDMETYFLSDGHLFEIKGRIEKDKREARLATLFRIAHATRPRDMEEVPQEKGYCLQDLFVALPNKLNSYIGISFDNENVDSRFSYNVVVSNSVTTPEKGYNWPPEARRRQVAGLKGVQAWGMENNTYPGSRVYAGEFYAYQPPRDDDRSLSINTRIARHYIDPNSPPFSIEVAYRFWDIVLNSIRPR